jgi:hypothetical protein
MLSGGVPNPLPYASSNLNLSGGSMARGVSTIAGIAKNAKKNAGR